MVNNLKYIVKQLILSNKYIFSNVKNILLLLMFSMICLALPVVFVPLRYSFSVYIIIATVIPSGIVYVSIAYSWREGTLYRNLNSTNNNKYNFYLAMFIEMLLVAFVLLFISLGCLVVLDSFGFLLTDWIWSSNQSALFDYKFMRINYIALFYSEFECVLIMFSILFFSQNLTDKKKNIYFLILSLVVITIIYGGVFNNYFTRKVELKDGVAVPRYMAMMFPDPVYWLSLFFPLFGPSQHLASIGSSFLYDGASDGFSYLGQNSFRFFVWENSTKLGITHLDTFRWNILWILPYVWVVLFAIGGLFVNKVN